MLGKLKNCISLRSNVKIYVPSTINVDQPIENTAWIDMTLNRMSDLFGGATGYACYGAWISREGRLVKERVTICESFCTEQQLEASIDDIYDYCVTLRESLAQEAVSLEVNGVLHFI